MLFFGIVLLIGIIIVFIVFFNSYLGFAEIFVPIVMACVMLSLCVSGIVYNLSEHETVETECVDIFSLQDHLTGDGTFFLGSGSANGKMKYYYYYESEYGLEYDSVSADSVTIVFDDEPRLITYKDQFKNRTLANWFFEFGSTKKVLYIPQNTVIDTISIDLN